MQKRSLGYRVGHFILIGWMDGAISLFGWFLLVMVGFMWGKYFLKPFVLGMLTRFFG